MKNIKVPNLKTIYLSEEPDLICISEFSKEYSEELDKLSEDFERAGDKERKEIEKEISELIGINSNKVITYGELPEKPPSIFKRHCGKEKIYTHAMSLKEKFLREPVNSFRCFLGMNDTYSKFHFIMHEDIVSSWNCALNKLGNPKYGIIYIGKKTQND